MKRCWVSFESTISDNKSHSDSINHYRKTTTTNGTSATTGSGTRSVSDSETSSKSTTSKRHTESTWASGNASGSSSYDSSRTNGSGVTSVHTTDTDLTWATNVWADGDTEEHNDTTTWSSYTFSAHGGSEYHYDDGAGSESDSSNSYNETFTGSASIERNLHTDTGVDTYTGQSSGSADRTTASAWNQQWDFIGTDGAHVTGSETGGGGSATHDEWDVTVEAGSASGSYSGSFQQTITWPPQGSSSGGGGSGSSTSSGYGYGSSWSSSYNNPITSGTGGDDFYYEGETSDPSAPTSLSDVPGATPPTPTTGTDPEAGRGTLEFKSARRRSAGGERQHGRGLRPLDRHGPGGHGARF